MTSVTCRVVVVFVCVCVCVCRQRGGKCHGQTAVLAHGHSDVFGSYRSIESDVDSRTGCGGPVTRAHACTHAPALE